jgi:anionic cell wall polymer biosynthesis LytR-Cps2A-Psr (LCP) family protein
MRTHTRRPWRAVVVILALTIAGTGSLAGPVSAANGMRFNASAWLDLAVKLDGFFPTIGDFADAMSGTAAISQGSDGRLTFLLAGSDSRFSAVSRTDSIMIMSIKGNTISAASIPRDTARIVRPASMGGGTFSGKVNGILRSLVQSEGSLDAGLNAFEKVIENLLQIEIDYHALIWFGGFTTLVDKVDPVLVDIGTSIRDGKHHDLDAQGPAGVYFPKANSYTLYAWNPSGYSGSPYCNGAWKSYTDPASHPSVFCHRALPFVRTRKGPGNNDFVRVRRQQNFIAATIKATSSSELSALVSTAQGEGLGKWWTNYPISMGSATDLYNAIHNGVLTNQVVFKPSIYSARISGTSGYELKLSAVRAWTAQYMS